MSLAKRMKFQKRGGAVFRPANSAGGMRRVGKLMLSIRKNQPDFYAHLQRREQYQQVGGLKDIWASITGIFKPNQTPEEAADAAEKTGGNDVTASNIIDSVSQAAQAYYATKQQNQLLKTNLKLVQAGKDPIDPGSVAPTVRVSNELTQALAKVVPWAALGLGAYLLFKAASK